MGRTGTENREVQLHIEAKISLFSVLLFSILSISLSFLFIVPTNNQWIQLISLIRAPYDYTAIIDKPIGVDDYYVYESGIVFMVSTTSDFRINAEILMQTDGSDYSPLMPLPREHLDAHEVAISQNIAVANGLKTGDKLFSKHLVSSRSTEYTIKQILLASIAPQSEKARYSDGVILMGFDEAYVSNIAHRIVVFSSSRVMDLSDIYGVYPFSIEYRSDVIWNTIKDLISPTLIAILSSIIVVLLQSCFFARCCRHNYKRLLLLGYPERDTRSVWNHSFLLIGIGSAAISFLFAETGIVIFIKSGTVLTLVILLVQVVAQFTLCHRFRLNIERR
jgi:hypothetical protein